MPAKTSKAIEKKATTFVRKTEKLLIKPKIPTGEPIEFETAKGSSQLCTIVIGTTSGTIQLVVHRPLGETTLNEKTDWVVSSCEEYKQLNTRLTDPNRGKVNLYRSEVRNKFLNQEAEALDLSIVGGKIMFSGGTRESRVVTARTMAQKIEKGLKENKKEKKEIDPLNPSYLKYLVRADQNTEKAILKKFNEKDFQKRVDQEVRKKFPVYSTKSGVKADRPQVAVTHLKGKSTSQMGDYFASLLYEGKDEVKEQLGRNVPEAPASEDPQETEDLMKNILDQVTNWPKDITEEDKLTLYSTFTITLLDMQEEQMIEFLISHEIEEWQKEQDGPEEVDEVPGSEDGEIIAEIEFEVDGATRAFSNLTPTEQLTVLKKRRIEGS